MAGVSAGHPEPDGQTGISLPGPCEGIGETVRLDTESFHGDYTVIGILESEGEREANTRNAK